MSDYKITELDGKFHLTNPQGNTYIVSITPNGKARCTCPGFKFRQVCKHLDMIPKPEIKRYPLPTIVHMFKSLVQATNWPHVRTELVGSARRLKPTCKDMDILICCSVGQFMLLLTEKIHELTINKRGTELISGHYYGIPFDITRVAAEGEWPYYTLYRTGSKDHNIMMRSRARALGWRLNEHGLWDGQTNVLPNPENEEAIYEKLGLKYAAPRWRE